MTPKEAHELAQRGQALLIDVREADELRRTGTAEGAMWLPLSAMVDDTDEWRAFKANTPKDKTLILFCQAGGRSGRMAEFLCCDGYQAVNLGGFSDWLEAGMPVSKFTK